MITIARFAFLNRNDYDCPLWSFSQIVMITIAHFGHFHKS